MTSDGLYLDMDDEMRVEHGTALGRGSGTYTVVMVAALALIWAGEAIGEELGSVVQWLGLLIAYPAIVLGTVAAFRGIGREAAIVILRWGAVTFVLALGAGLLIKLAFGLEDLGIVGAVPLVLVAGAASWVILRLRNGGPLLTYLDPGEDRGETRG